MRNIRRSATAVVLVLALVTPAAAATRSPRSSSGIMEAVKRFVVRATSRVSPPGGDEAPAPARLPDKTTKT